MVLFRPIHTISVPKAACPGTAAPVPVPIPLPTSSRLDPITKLLPQVRSRLASLSLSILPSQTAHVPFKSYTQQRSSNEWSGTEPLLTFFAPFPEGPNGRSCPHTTCGAGRTTPLLCPSGLPSSYASAVREVWSALSVFIDHFKILNKLLLSH